MKKGRHWTLSFVNGPRAYEFGRHERHVHGYYLGSKKWWCIGCGRPRPPAVKLAGGRR